MIRSYIRIGGSPQRITSTIYYFFIATDKMFRYISTGCFIPV